MAPPADKVRTVHHAQAQQELADAYNWLESEREGLGKEFARVVHAALEDLAEHPLRHPIIEQRARRCVLKRFPYVIIYEIKPDHVFIVSITHTSRSPGYWQSRVRKK
jgi:plasmid stabilization system protein ParE